MASCQGIDLLTILRLAPLVTSTGSLWFCVDQSLFLGCLVPYHNRAEHVSTIPAYWRSFFKPGLGIIFIMYGLTALAAVANLYSSSLVFSLGVTDTTRWYKLGLAFTLAHFAFVPSVAPLITRMIEDSTGESWRYQVKWLKIHAIRTMLVDLPGWLCYFAAALTSLRPA